MSCSSTKELVKFTPLSVLPYAHALPRRMLDTEMCSVKENYEESESVKHKNNESRFDPKVSISQFFEHGLIDVISFDVLVNNGLTFSNIRDKDIKYDKDKNSEPPKENSNNCAHCDFANEIVVSCVNIDTTTNEINDSCNESDSGGCNGNKTLENYCCTPFDSNEDDNNYDDNTVDFAFTEQYLNRLQREANSDKNCEHNQHLHEENVEHENMEINSSPFKSSTMGSMSVGSNSLLKFWNWRDANSCHFDKVTQNINSNTKITNTVNVPATLDTTMSMITVSNVLRARTASTFTLSSSSSATKNDNDG